MGYHLPALRALKAGLLDPTIGLNAQITALSAAGLLAGGDPAPPLFPAGAIGEETSEPSVADGGFPGTATPALALSQVAQTQYEGEILIQAGDRTVEQFPVMLRYLSGKSNQAEATRDWFYTARALLRFLRRFMLEGNEALRTVAEVRIVTLDRVVMLEPFQDRAGNKVTGGLGLLLTMRDRAP